MKSNEALYIDSFTESDFELNIYVLCTGYSNYWNFDIHCNFSGVTDFT